MLKSKINNKSTYKLLTIYEKEKHGGLAFRYLDFYDT